MSEGNWQPKDRMMLFLVLLHAVVKKKGVCQLAPLQTLRGLAGLKHLADADSCTGQQMHLTNYS